MNYSLFEAYIRPSGYEEKYIKYKKKYIQLKNQIGGIVEGRGSYGIVVSNPRVAFKDEHIIDVALIDNEVSKIFINEDSEVNMKKEIELYNKIISEHSDIITSENYILPIKYGEIDKLSLFIKSDNWFYDIDNNNYKQILNKNILTVNKLYQITFNKGTPINYNLSDFLIKILDIINCVKINIEHNLYFDDLKLNNLIKHNDKIKIIDFSSLIDLNNLSENEIFSNIIRSYLYEHFYFINNPIVSIFLSTKNLNSIKIIKNYVEIVFNNSDMYNDYLKNIYHYSFLNKIDKSIFISLDIYNITTEKIESVDINSSNLNNNFNILHLYIIKNKINTLEEEIKKLNNLDEIKDENQEQLTKYIVEIDKLSKYYNYYIQNIRFYSDSLFYKLSNISDNLGKKYKLLELSQIYMIGIIFVFKLNNYFKLNKSYDINLIKKYLKIISMCCLLFGKTDNGDLFYTNYSIDDIISFIQS
jgi:hypothetical protein